MGIKTSAAASTLSGLVAVSLGLGACQANPPRDEPQQPAVQSSSTLSTAEASTPRSAPRAERAGGAQSVQPVASQQAPAAGSGSVEGNLYFVRTLIERSSAAQKVTASRDPDAIAKREQARAKYQEAQRAVSAGDNETAQQSLNQAKMLMFEAARLADKEGVLEGKKKSDYENRLGSVQALMAAHERVTEDKGEQAVHRQLEPKVEERVQQAQALAAREEYEAARSELDVAYLSIKASIERLRSGDTLVRSLNFASKEEEYRYELDRNETLRMLVTVLLKDRLQQSGVSQMVDRQMGKANELRQTAEAEAEAGNYQAAIDSLDASTKQIIRAIRSAGVYVPG